MRKTLCAMLTVATLLAQIACSNLQKDSRPEAIDAVCLYNRDLGCVRVRVDAATPHATHAGKVYYFCGDGCREIFEREPEKYIAALPKD